MVEWAATDYFKMNTLSRTVRNHMPHGVLVDGEFEVNGVCGGVCGDKICIFELS